jgi:hypothetical protein
MRTTALAILGLTIPIVALTAEDPGLPRRRCYTNLLNLLSHSY